MSAVSRIPWSVFLPADVTWPTLVLGDPDPDVAAQLEGRRLVGPGFEERPGAILRLPGGPSPDPAEIERLSRTLGPGGHWVWISRRAGAPETSERYRSPLGCVPQTTVWTPVPRNSRSIASDFSRVGSSNVSHRPASEQMYQ